MIDWATVICYAPHFRSDLGAGLVLELDEQGEISRGREKSLQVRSSWETSVIVSSHNPECPYLGFPVKGDAVHQSSTLQRDWVRIDGNPAKWFEGHNLYGTDDPDLITWFALDVLRRLRIPVPDRASSPGWLRLNRIDVTRSFRLDSDDHVAAFLRSLETHATMKYSGRGNVGRGSTFYFRQKSRRLGGKAYSKSKELIDHALPVDLPNREALYAWAKGLVRWEWRYLSMELQRHGITYVDQLTVDSVRELWKTAMDKVTFLKQSPACPPGISRAAAGTFAEWVRGGDPQVSLPRSTWYRHRRELLAEGIDISIPSGLGDDVPVLTRELFARPARPPDFASCGQFSVAA